MPPTMCSSVMPRSATWRARSTNWSTLYAYARSSLSVHTANAQNPQPTTQMLVGLRCALTLYVTTSPCRRRATVGGLAEILERGVTVQGDRLFGGDALAVSGAGKNRIDHAGYGIKPRRGTARRPSPSPLPMGPAGPIEREMAGPGKSRQRRLMLA